MISPPLYMQHDKKKQADFLKKIAYLQQLHHTETGAAQEIVEQILQTEWQFQALQSQLNSHFLFNSLNTLQKFVSENDCKKAANFVAKFGRLLRTMTSYNARPYISLAKELQFIEHFIQFESLRYGRKINYQLVVEKGVDSHYQLLPPMLLYPYLENVIWQMGYQATEQNIIIKIGQSSTQCLTVDICYNSDAEKNIMGFKILHLFNISRLEWLFCQQNQSNEKRQLPVIFQYIENEKSQKIRKQICIKIPVQESEP